MSRGASVWLRAFVAATEDTETQRYVLLCVLCFSVAATEDTETQRYSSLCVLCVSVASPLPVSNDR
jgi:hypothetical protein